ncbi:MAG TPA: hypothetical protein VF214_08155 [Edaphobacter sp.]
MPVFGEIFLVCNLLMLVVLLVYGAVEIVICGLDMADATEGTLISYQLSAISYQLSAISYQLSAISYQLSAISYPRESSLIRMTTSMGYSDADVALGGGF